MQPKRRLTFWSTSKLRTLNSIFTFEYRFLWKAQFILKSWMDNLKVIYSWLIFRDQKKKIQYKSLSQIYWTLFWLGLDWIFIHSVLTFLCSSLVDGMSLAMLSSAVLPPVLKWSISMARLPAWDGLFPAEPFAVMDDTRNSNTFQFGVFQALTGSFIPHPFSPTLIFLWAHWLPDKKMTHFLKESPLGRSWCHFFK